MHFFLLYLACNFVKLLMRWNKLAPYQQLFISALILMGIYLILSRVAGMWVGPDTLNYPKILRWFIGLLFVIVAAKIYFFPAPHVSDIQKPEE